MVNYRTSFQLMLDEDNVSVNYVPQQYLSKHAWNTERHCNAHYELHFLLQGSCRIEVEDRQYDLHQNQVILIAPGKYHYPKVVSGEIERLVCSFSLSKGALSHTLAQRVSACTIIPLSSDAIAICHSVLRECAAVKPFRNVLIQSYLTQLILQIFRTLELSKAVLSTASASGDSARIAEIDNYFALHFAENANIEVLAKALHLSRRQLARVLQKQYGMSFREKLLSTRMDHAAWLLRTTDRPTIRIAEGVGYASESAFYKSFRSYFHTTPQQYRQQFRTAPHTEE